MSRPTVAPPTHLVNKQILGNNIHRNAPILSIYVSPNYEGLIYGFVTGTDGNIFILDKEN